MIDDSSVYGSLNVALITLAVLCLLLFAWAAVLLKRNYRRQLDTSSVNISEESSVPFIYYDKTTIWSMGLILITIALKITYLLLVVLNLAIKAKVPHATLNAIELVSMLCLVISMGVEFERWLCYDARINAAGKL